MDTFSRNFVQKVEEKLSILSKVWTDFLRQNSCAREVWTSFMLTCVNSCPYNFRVVVNFTVICQIYVRKIEILFAQITTRTFTVLFSFFAEKARLLYTVIVATDKSGKVFTKPSLEMPIQRGVSCEKEVKLHLKALEHLK